MSDDVIRNFLLFWKGHLNTECPAGDQKTDAKKAEVREGRLVGTGCNGEIGGCCSSSISLDDLAEELIELSGFPLGHSHRWGPPRGGGYRLCEIMACPAYLTVDGKVKQKEKSHA